MYLPQQALTCINRLRDAGFAAYAVGGCVRDSLLGKMPHDYDLCTNAKPEEICRIFADCTLVHSGEKHGTVGVVMDGQVYEITTFRTEGGYTDSRHPDWVAFVDSVEADLARRDFTVNAMAYSPETGYIDPWGGQKDLQAKQLRAVGDPYARFTEDALRILRGVRFAVRFGLTPTQDTLQAMFDLAPHMEKLARERVFEELCKLLPIIQAADLVYYAPILTQVIPELTPCVGFAQHNPHHIYDVYTHTARVVEAAPGVLAVRWAALLHDVGKPRTFSMDDRGVGHFYGHAQESARLADEILRRLKAPNALRERVVFLIDKHMLPPELEKKTLLRRLGKYGPEALLALMDLQEADSGQSLTDARNALTDLLEESPCITIRDLAINGKDLMGMFSLDFRFPQKVTCTCSEEEFCRFHAQVTPFLAA